MMRLASILPFIGLMALLIAVSSCDSVKGDRESFVKLEGLLPETDMDQIMAVIIVRLENACSPCATSTLWCRTNVSSLGSSTIPMGC